MITPITLVPRLLDNETAMFSGTQRWVSTTGRLAPTLTLLSAVISDERAIMTWKDKLELGIKEDAAFRKDNLPPNEVRGPEIPTGPGRSPEIPLAREEKEDIAPSVDGADDREKGAADRRSRDEG